MQKQLAKICRSILSDTNSRNLFFFLILNFFFAFVELTYGLWTNSLGLISDSFHMFFDCTALILGLVASIISKKGADDKFTYGFGRAEILAGLANGLFLLFIALFILKEAVERAFEPPEVHHERLFVISVLGFFVNLIGIFVFQHGGQGHGGCSHSHSHPHAHSKSNSHKSDHDHSHDHDHHHHHHHHHHHDHGHQHHDQQHFESPTYHEYPTKLHSHLIQSPEVSLDMNGSSQHNGAHYLDYGQQNKNNLPIDNHGSASYGHCDHSVSDTTHLIGFESTHHLDNVKENKPGQIMQSVFLHIVADTLGSIGVMISAVLMNQFGWMIADPLCSIFIAVMIMISVYPLLKDSVYILMQRTPVELENQIVDCIRRVKSINGILSIQEHHFWTLNSGNYVGAIKVEAARHIDPKSLLYTIKGIFSQIKVHKIHIEIDPV